MTEPNTHRPGLPDYVGPKVGIFFCVHHDVLAEASANIMERVEYIPRAKPDHERATRLRCLLWLDLIEVSDAARTELGAAYQEWDAAYQKWDAANQKWDAAYQKWNAARQEWDAARQEWDAAYQKWDAAYQKWDAARQDLDAALSAHKPELLAYLFRHIPDAPWVNGQLVFGEATA